MVSSYKVQRKKTSVRACGGTEAPRRAGGGATVLRLAAPALGRRIRHIPPTAQPSLPIYNRRHAARQRLGGKLDAALSHGAYHDTLVSWKTHTGSCV